MDVFTYEIFILYHDENLCTIAYTVFGKETTHTRVRYSIEKNTSSVGKRVQITTCKYLFTLYVE